MYSKWETAPMASVWVRQLPSPSYVQDCVEPSASTRRDIFSLDRPFEDGDGPDRVGNHDRTAESGACLASSWRWTHKDEEQTIVLHDRADLNLVFRLRRWLAYLAEHDITTGPVFREVMRSGKVASSETRAKKTRRRLTARGDYLWPQTVNERVKKWFYAAGLTTDGRPVSSHRLRAGGATDLGVNNATEEELEYAGRWAKGSPIPRTAYVRPAKDAKYDPFNKVPVHPPQAEGAA